MKQSHPLLGKMESLSCDVVETQVKFLQGKVLTILDAAFQPGEQKKAVKDLVNKSFSDQLSYITQLCYPETIMMTRDQAESLIEDIDDVVANAELVTDED